MNNSHIVDEFRNFGKCPICREELQEVDGFAECGDHYSISMDTFIELWGKTDRNEIDAEGLLTLLLEGNNVKDSI